MNLPIEEIKIIYSSIIKLKCQGVYIKNQFFFHPVIGQTQNFRGGFSPHWIYHCWKGKNDEEGFVGSN